MPSTPTPPTRPPVRTGPSRRGLLKAGAAGAVVVPALAACGGGSGGSGASAANRLRVGVAGGSAADTLDAHQPTDNTDIARTHNLYSTLCAFGTDYSIGMALAESVESNAEATVWTVVLREGLTFHDGSPITADDVVFTFRRITDPDAPGVNAAQLATLDRDNLRVVDDRTAELVFTEPYVTFLDLVAEYSTGIVPEGYDPDAPIGSGPFKLVEFTPGQRSLFAAHEGYWQEGMPYVAELEIINFPDETARVNALVGGQVDVISQLPHALIPVIEANDNLRVLDSETGMWLPFTMRVDQPPFDDVRVRQAFRLMVDRQQMVDVALAGYGSVGNDVYGRFDPAYHTDLPQRERDIDEARRLLAEAGHGDGLEVELVTGPISPGAEAAAQVFKEHARDAGVTVNLRQTTSTEFYGDNYLQWTFAMDFWSTRNYLSQAAQGSMPDAAFNETHWDDPEWVGLIERARATVDEDERADLIRQAMEIEYERGGYIVWGFVNTVDGFSSRVTGFEPSVTGHPLTSYGFHRVRIEGR